MPVWPANGVTDWNDKMKAVIDVSLDSSTGKILVDAEKASAMTGAEGDRVVTDKGYVDTEIASATAGSGFYKSSNVSVFDTSMTSANAWQDLDLSAQIGTQRTLVMLQVTGTTTATAYQLRPKDRGSVSAPPADYSDHTPNGFAGSSAFQVSGTTIQYLMCETDETGVIQQGSSSASANWEVTLIGYVK